MGGGDGKAILRGIVAALVTYVLISWQIRWPYGLGGLLMIGMIAASFDTRRLLVMPGLPPAVRRGRYYGIWFGVAVFWSLAFMPLHDLDSAAPLSFGQFLLLLLPVAAMLGIHLMRGIQMAATWPRILDVATGGAFLAFVIASFIALGSEVYLLWGIGIVLAVAGALSIRAFTWLFGQCWPNLFGRVGIVIAAAALFLAATFPLALWTETLQARPSAIIVVGLATAAAWLVGLLIQTRLRRTGLRPSAA